VVTVNVFQLKKTSCYLSRIILKPNFKHVPADGVVHALNKCEIHNLLGRWQEKKCNGRRKSFKKRSITFKNTRLPLLLMLWNFLLTTHQQWFSCFHLPWSFKNFREICKEISFLSFFRKMLMSAFLLRFKANYLEKILGYHSFSLSIPIALGLNMAQKPWYLVGTVLTRADRLTLLRNAWVSIHLHVRWSQKNINATWLPARITSAEHDRNVCREGCYYLVHGSIALITRQILQV